MTAARRAVIPSGPAPTYSWSGDDFGSGHYRDIMVHTPPARRWSKPGVGPSTVAHETLHGMQWARSAAGPDKYRYFYFERGRGIYVPEPRVGLRPLHRNASGGTVYTQDAFTNMARVREFVPASVRKLAHGRYETYLLAPGRRTYGVLTLFEEWDAYVADARVSVEVYRHGKYFANYVRKSGRFTTTRRVDGVDGTVDFLYFCAAAVAALAKYEPAYLRRAAPLKKLFIALTEWTNKWMRAGLAIEIFRGFHAAKLYRHLQTDPDSAHVRHVLRGWLGAAWTKQHLGF